MDEDFLLHKKVICPCCEKEFDTLQVKSGKARRLNSDIDLRPRCEQLDTLKYGALSCPNCGYTALARTFDTLTAIQRKLLQEKFCESFELVKTEEKTMYTYDMAIDYHKLALINVIEKKGKFSEKAYVSLVIAWLNRGKREELEQKNDPKYEPFLQMCKEEEMNYIEQAYDGFVKALATEVPPFCGLDMTTTEYLISSLAWQLRKYEVAAKTLSTILTSKTASRHVKDKALDLKELIISDMKKIEF